MPDEAGGGAIIITQNIPKANFDDRQIKLRIEAQGGLFAVAIESDLPRRTQHSTAHDLKMQRKHTARIYQNYQKDFSFEEIFEALDCTGRQADTSIRCNPEAPYYSQDRYKRALNRTTEQDPVYMPVITPEAKAQIEREALFATLREIHDQPKRKMIAEFSRKSRLRLLKLVTRLEKNASGKFLTFTYRENMQDHTEAKVHLDLLLRYLKYHYKQGAFLWRMEYQKRGAIHFHVIAFNVAWIDIDALTAYWQEMTGDDSYPDVEAIHNRRKAMYYVSKYVAKHERTDISGFISEPYSEKPQFFGRFWGVVNRKNLPLAVRTYFRVVGDAKVFHDLRRYARRFYAGLSRRYQGFCLLTVDGNQWLDLMYRSELETGRVYGLRV